MYLLSVAANEKPTVTFVGEEAKQNEVEGYMDKEEHEEETEESIDVKTEEYTEEVDFEISGSEPVQLSNTSTTKSGVCGNYLKWTLEDGVLTISGTGKCTTTILIPVIEDHLGGQARKRLLLKKA